MYRNPGPSGPQLRDFNSIIQTCSGNIQRISQASERGDPAGGGLATRGTGLVEVAKTRSPVPAAVKAIAGAAVSLHSGRGELLPRVGQARALQVHTPILSVVSSPGWVNRADLTARGWKGACVISRTVNNSLDLVQWSAEFFLSSPPPHPPRFPQFGSGLACWLRLWVPILLSGRVVGHQQLSIKGSGECVCLIHCASCN